MVQMWYEPQNVLEFVDLVYRSDQVMQNDLWARKPCEALPSLFYLDVYSGAVIHERLAYCNGGTR